MENIKKHINFSAIFYVGILVIITLLIGFASGNKTDSKTATNNEVKTIKVMAEIKQIVTLEFSLKKTLIKNVLGLKTTIWVLLLPLINILLLILT